MAKTPAKKKSATKPKATVKKKAAGSSKRSATVARAKSGPGAADAFVNLLQSPLVADLVAVAATAALAALAEKGFSSSGGKKKAAGQAVKAAGKAAAAAIGRRLTDEIAEIKAASKAAKAK